MENRGCQNSITITLVTSSIICLFYSVEWTTDIQLFILIHFTLTHLGRGHAATDNQRDIPIGVKKGRRCLQFSGGRNVSHCSSIVFDYHDAISAYCTYFSFFLFI